MQFEVDMMAPGAERIIGTEHRLDVIAEGVVFGEGPVWDQRSRQFYFTDICGDTIWKCRPGSRPQVVLQPSAHANGMCMDRDGRLLVAGWGGRTVFRFEKDGSRVTLASHYDGKKINSPNDIVVRSDGQIYFTDSPGGMLNAIARRGRSGLTMDSSPRLVLDRHPLCALEHRYARMSVHHFDL